MEIMNLIKIQKYLKKNKINIFLINRTDEFLNEYIAPYAERLKWISNFSGSAGRAIILENKAYIFVDGRYSFQVHSEVNTNFFLIEPLKDYWKILEKIIKKNFYIGIDPLHHSYDEFKILNMITKPNKGGVTFKKDEDIYKYYGITKDEQKLIEEVVDHVKSTKRTHEKKQIQTQKKKKGGRRKNKRTIRKRRR